MESTVAIVIDLFFYNWNRLFVFSITGTTICDRNLVDVDKYEARALSYTILSYSKYIFFSYPPKEMSNYFLHYGKKSKLGLNGNQVRRIEYQRKRKDDV